MAFFKRRSDEFDFGAPTPEPFGSVKPGRPVVPGAPDAPSAPGALPGAPDAPGVPPKPSAPYAPYLPSAPYAPSAPPEPEGAYDTARTPQKREASFARTLFAIILSVLAGLAPFVSGFFLLKGCYDEQVQEELQAKRDTLSFAAGYADDFQMRCIANPEIKGNSSYISEIPRKTESYSSVRFGMELPNADGCEPNTVYFAPDYSGKTQASIDYYNYRIALAHPDNDITPYPFPTTYDELINNSTFITYNCKSLFIAPRSYLDYPKPVWDCLREGLYAKIFMLQAKGQPIAAYDGFEFPIEPDNYLNSLNSTVGGHFEAAQSVPPIKMVFVAEPPANDELAEGSLYLYPHQEGNTRQLIGKLNQVVAESPELLDGTGLSAPLTIENILHDHEQVWKIINGLSLNQVMYFHGFQDVQGAQGAQGGQGAQGVQGAQGGQGFQGFQGVSGRSERSGAAVAYKGLPRP